MVKHFSEYHMDLNLGEIIYIRLFLNWLTAIFSGHIFEKEFFIPPFLSVFRVMYVMLKGLKARLYSGSKVYR